ncbi:MAG: response regulator transcription factor [Terracidiphilus sp.]|nr:response regulator transcription factor [Terracidiphilus sp.]MDR3796999.1 response regulator transcription factor [Terracidiphilus sp.]
MEDILLIDDDVELCSMLTDYLGRYEFRVHSVHRGDEGLKTARGRDWALILLDVMLPGLDGFEVLKQIRASSDVSVMLLTARGEDIDRIVGLEIGADDYLPKPFNPRELLARMRAILRRHSGAATRTEPALLRVDDLELDAAARSVMQGGKKIDLTSVEFALLETLMRFPGQVVSREQLSESVLGRKFDPFDRSLDMHVSRLRRKLSENGARDEQVKTIRGAGYQLAVGAARQAAEG